MGKFWAVYLVAGGDYNPTVKQEDGHYKPREIEAESFEAAAEAAKKWFIEEDTFFGGNDPTADFADGDDPTKIIIFWKDGDIGIPVAGLADRVREFNYKDVKYAVQD
jgi:hypothetical protein